MTEPAKGKVIPLPDPDPEPMPGKEPPEKHYANAGPRLLFCGLRLSNDASDICMSNSFRLVLLGKQLVFVCTECHREHKALEGMKCVEL